MRVGVMALQGSFLEHARMLERLETETLPVRRAHQLAEIDGLILPGGESTALIRLMEREDLMERIRSLAGRGLPVFGTCAGLVLLAAGIENSGQPRLGLLDVTVRRNGFGGQLESFESELDAAEPGEERFPGVFIRAPRILKSGRGVRVLFRLPDGAPAAVRQNNLLAASFHPELTGDQRLHRIFLDMIR